MERNSVVNADIAETCPPASNAKLDCFPALQKNETYCKCTNHKTCQTDVSKQFYGLKLLLFVQGETPKNLLLAAHGVTQISCGDRTQIATHGYPPTILNCLS